jgi:hypothetical protein
MIRLLWRIRFMLAVMWIYRDFKGLQLKLGWTVSGRTKYTYMKPYDAALEEIGDWYDW